MAFEQLEGLRWPMRLRGASLFRMGGPIVSCREPVERRKHSGRSSRSKTQIVTHEVLRTRYRCRLVRKIYVLLILITGPDERWSTETKRF